MSKDIDATPPQTAAAAGAPGHTPGPWKLETVRTSCGICHKIGPFPGHGTWKVGNACIYVDYPGTGPREAELEANARLIAAAPDLLGVLASIKDELGFAEWGTPEQAEELLSALIRKYWEPASAAISKATGAPQAASETSVTPTPTGEA